MSFALLGALAGAGPGMTQARQNKVMESDAQLRRNKDDREGQMFDWVKELGNIMQTRNAVTNPAFYQEGSWRNYFDGPGAAAPTMLPQSPAAPAPAALPGAADGGEMEVPQQGMPAPQPQQQAIPQMSPTPENTPKVPSRRERYDDWYNKAAKYATLTGGLEGYQKFQEMENATARREMLGYAMQAVQAMDYGNVGDAMKAANTALEASPFDTGMKFTAQNGKLYMQGSDGSLSEEPLDANALRAFTEQTLKTPENFLDFKKQAETERSNKANEATSLMNAESNAKNVAEYVRRGPVSDRLSNSQAFANLARGTASLEGDGDDDGLGWNVNNLLKIEQMAEEANEGGHGFGQHWMTEAIKGSQLFNEAVGSSIAVRRMNRPDDMGHSEASTIARAAYFMDLPEELRPDAMRTVLAGMTVVKDPDTGRMGVKLANNDKVYNVPKIVGLKIKLNQQQAPAQ